MQFYLLSYVEKKNFMEKILLMITIHLENSETEHI